MLIRAPAREKDAVEAGPTPDLAPSLDPKAEGPDPDPRNHDPGLVGAVNLDLHLGIANPDPEAGPGQEDLDLKKRIRRLPAARNHDDETQAFFFLNTND